jgi:hypothetical protein
LSDEVERLPSMRKPSRQGVPTRKPRDMAKPMADGGQTRVAPSIVPRATAPEPPTPEEPTLPLDLPTPPEPAPVERMKPEPQPEPGPVAVTEPEPELVASAAPEPMPAPDPEPTPEVQPDRPPQTMRDLFARVEPAFRAFRDAAYGYPAEHMNDRMGSDGWTRKQMLSHIAAWHDITTDRLIKMGTTGQPVPVSGETVAINAAAARVAMGKTAGEVLKDLEASYARLRRHMLRMTDADLRLWGGWAALQIADDTYDHYEQHMPDLVPPGPWPAATPER